MKKSIVIILGIVVLLGAIVFAAPRFMHGHGDHHNPEMMAKKHTEMMAEKLSLTDEQEEKVLAINLQYAKKMAAIKKGGYDDKEKAHADYKVLVEEKINELEKVLTSEQLEKFLEMKKDGHHGKFGHHMGGDHSSMMGEVHDKILPMLKEKRQGFDSELSDEERVLIKSFRTEHPMSRKGFGGHPHPGHFGHDSDAKKEKHKEVMAKYEPIIAVANDHQASLRAIFEEMRHEIKSEFDFPEKVEKIIDKKMDSHFDMMAIHFLLLDPEEESFEDAEGASFDVKAFPNPAGDQTKIEYEVMENGPVRIDLLDRNGVVVKNLFDAQQEKGAHSLTVDLHDVSGNGYYIISVTTKSGTVNTKLLKMEK